MIQRKGAGIYGLIAASAAGSSHTIGLKAVRADPVDPPPFRFGDVHLSGPRDRHRSRVDHTRSRRAAAASRQILNAVGLRDLPVDPNAPHSGTAGVREEQVPERVY
jgi:hypothetical protein